MKVCIDARYVFPKMDGIGRYLVNLIDELSNISLGDPGIHFYILEVDEFSTSSYLRNFDDRKNLTLIKIPVKPQTLKNNFIASYLKELKIDIYHYPQFDLPIFLPDAKIVTTIHDLNPQKFKGFFSSKAGWIKKQYSVYMNAFALKKSDKLIAISQSTKNEIIDFYGVRYKEKVSVVFEGVKQFIFSVDEMSNLTKKLSHLRKSYRFEKYFLYVGNNRPHKNLSGALKAFKSFLMQPSENIHFVLVGRYLKNNTDIDGIVKKLGIEKNIIKIEANEDELKSLYLGAEAFIFCSLSEGFGLPILEAMSLGIPVITSNLSSMKEIAEGYAMLVNPYSTEEISSAMMRIINSPELKKDLSEKGLKRAGELSWTQCAENTLKIYQELFIAK
jgi:glycosyltransferase involved in cell wall biosynthesis